MLSHPATVSFKETVNPESLKILGSPQRIWVFGGQLSDQGSPSLSIRDAFLKKCFKVNLPWIKEISKPEDYPDWWKFSGYDDLLLFERDAGYLSRLIVIFAESPGAIAELGAFALDSNLHQQLFVVLARSYREEPHRKSFINLGPISRVESAHSKGDHKGICVIEAKKYSELTEDELDLIVDELNSFQSLLPHYSRVTFHNNNPTHQLLLIADLVDLFQVSKFEEILNLLEFFNVKYTLDEIKKSSKLLDLLGLIKLAERGSEHFLVTTKRNEPLVDYTGATGKRFERLQFKNQSNLLIQSDPRRKPLLEAAK